MGSSWWEGPAANPRNRKMRDNIPNAEEEGREEKGEAVNPQSPHLNHVLPPERFHPLNVP